MGERYLYHRIESNVMESIRYLQSEQQRRVHIIHPKCYNILKGVCDMRLKPINDDQLNFTYAKNVRMTTPSTSFLLDHE